MKTSKPLAAAAGLLIGASLHSTSVAEVPGGFPPAGHYACLTANGGLLGYLDVKGSTYRGIALKPAGAANKIGMDSNGALLFAAGLGGFFASSGVKLGEARYMGTQGSSGHRPWIGIKYVSPRGNNERLDCQSE